MISTTRRSPKSGRSSVESSTVRVVSSRRPGPAIFLPARAPKSQRSRATRVPVGGRPVVEVDAGLGEIDRQVGGDAGFVLERRRIRDRRVIGDGRA
jgi:hypothetical protein